MATAPTTVRLPPELGERLDDYCEATGAVKNRVIALALKSYLADERVPVARRFDGDEVDRLEGVYHETVAEHGR
jgi:predicted transcriptional regulator